MIDGRKLHRDNKGAVMAEFALAVPILIGILFFVIEFGNILYLSNSLNQIARSAARYAAVNTSYTSATLKTAANSSSILPIPASLTLSFSPSSSVMVGDAITITASYSYTPMVNLYRFFSFFTSSATWTPTLSSVAVSRAEVASN